MELSNKHGARADDDLKRDTRVGPEETREQEPDASRDDVDDPQSTDLDAVERRAELARHLDPSAFPARPAELLGRARENFAPERVVRLLERLPDDLYETPNDVWLKAEGPVERERF